MNIIKKIKVKTGRKILYASRDAREAFGLNERFFRNARGSRIMVYHGLCEEDHLRFNTIFLKKRTFEDHLKFYRKYFNIVSLDDYYRQRFHKNKFNICITFDDGFANNYKYVLPLLEQYQVAATFFITAIRNAGYDFLWNDFLAILGKYGPPCLTYRQVVYCKNNYGKYIPKNGGTNLTDLLRLAGFAEKAAAIRDLYPLFPFKKDGINEDYWLQMTRQQIKQLSRSCYATIGAHGYYHNDLAQMELDAATDEMRRSKTYLENIIQKPVDSIAFPYGSYTTALTGAARQLGYNQILPLDFRYPESHTDPALRERFAVNPFISVTNQMYAAVTGQYE